MRPDRASQVSSISSAIHRCCRRLLPRANPRSFLLIACGKAVPRCQRALPHRGPGAGKTVIAKQLAAQLSHDYRLCLSTSYRDCSPFSEERVPVLRARFSEWLNEAAWKAPSLLILDNIDRIIPAEMEHVDSQRSRQLAEAFVARLRDCVSTLACLSLPPPKAPQVCTAC